MNDEGKILKSKVEQGIPLTKKEEIKYLMLVQSCTKEQAIMIVNKGYEDVFEIKVIKKRGQKP